VDYVPVGAMRDRMKRRLSHCAAMLIPAPTAASLGPRKPGSTTCRGIARARPGAAGFNGLNKDELEQENTILRRRLAITHETNRRITAALTGLPAATRHLPICRPILRDQGSTAWRVRGQSPLPGSREAARCNENVGRRRASLLSPQWTQEIPRRRFGNTINRLHEHCVVKCPGLSE